MEVLQKNVSSANQFFQAAERCDIPAGEVMNKTGHLLFRNLLMVLLRLNYILKLLL